MKHRITSIMAAIVVASLALAGCSQSAPAPTSAPAAPTASLAALGATTAPVAPTKAPEAAPAKKSSFPEKGKAITLIVPFGAGGGSDIGARAMAPFLEKELGTPIEIVNKPGAGTQVGMTELARAKPDGYTVGFTNLPSGLPTYMDPDRKAAYARKDFIPLFVQGVDPGVIAVKADSPIKDVKGLVDAAKANPKGLKGSTAGIMTSVHLQILELERVAGVSFTSVHFNSDAEGLTALLGSHVDFTATQVVASQSMVKSGQVRLLGVMDSQESQFMPGVKTFDAQGFKVVMDNSRIISAPAGTPKEVVDTYSTAMKKIMADPDYKQKMDNLAVTLRWMDAEQISTYWDAYEKRIAPLIELGKKSD